MLTRTAKLEFEAPTMLDEAGLLKNLAPPDGPDFSGMYIGTMTRRFAEAPRDFGHHLSGAKG